MRPILEPRCSRHRWATCAITATEAADTARFISDFDVGFALAVTEVPDSAQILIDPLAAAKRYTEEELKGGVFQHTEAAMEAVDIAALKRALQVYKRLSTRAAAEVAALQLKRGWKIAAKHAAERLQRVDLGLKDHELPPCKLRPQTIGSVTEVWWSIGRATTFGVRRWQ